MVFVQPLTGKTQSNADCCENNGSQNIILVHRFHQREPYTTSVNAFDVDYKGIAAGIIAYFLIGINIDHEIDTMEIVGNMVLFVLIWLVQSDVLGLIA